MHILQDFIPDFTPKITTGTICNRRSTIMCFEGLCFISLFNTLNIWNLKTQELVNSFKTRKHPISTFRIHKNFIFIGCEDGSIEIIRDCISSIDSSNISKNENQKVLKPHSKKITKILNFENFLISSSLDGTICCYDLILDEIKFFYSGNTFAVESICLTENQNLLAVCSDRSIRIWDAISESIRDAIALDDDIFDCIPIGQNILICCKNGKSFLINLETKEKTPFETFKNIRNIKLIDTLLYIQTQRKMSIFQKSNLIPVKRISTSPDFTNFDVFENQICFISTENKIVLGDKPIDFGFHRSEILDIKADHSKIFSLSKDRLICWNKTVENPLKDGGLNDVDDFTIESLEPLFLIEVKNACCFELFSNSIVVGTSEGLILIDRKFNEIKEKLEIGNVSSISSNDNYLAVCVSDSVVFYDKSFKETNNFQAPENITYSVLLNDAFYCSCLDNKIYQFTFPSLELKISFYGHSLPVRNFSISQDQKLLVSCGADKLVKLWGTEFGDCRKSFVGNCKNVKFLNETLFMFCDKDLQYFDYFEKLKKFKIFDSGLICPGTDYLIVTSGRGLCLFTMNKYEFVREEDSSELEQLAIKNVASVQEYDTFLDYIQKLEENFDDLTILLFFDFLEKIDFNELKKYLYVLDQVSISLLLKFILKNQNRNPIVLFRLFSQIFKCHKESCIENELFEEIRIILYSRVVELRELYNMNLAKLEIDLNTNDICE